MRPTPINGKDDTLALCLTQCWVEMSISGTFVTNVSLMDYYKSKFYKESSLYGQTPVKILADVTPK